MEHEDHASADGDVFDLSAVVTDPSGAGGARPGKYASGTPIADAAAGRVDSGCRSGRERIIAGYGGRGERASTAAGRSHRPVLQPEVGGDDRAEPVSAGGAPGGAKQHGGCARRATPSAARPRV